MGWIGSEAVGVLGPLLQGYLPYCASSNRGQTSNGGVAILQPKYSMDTKFSFARGLFLRGFEAISDERRKKRGIDSADEEKPYLNKVALEGC